VTSTKYADNPPVAPSFPQGSKLEVCSDCGSKFRCEAQVVEQKCWCTELPKLKEVSGSSCFCPGCLAKRVKKQESLGLGRYLVKLSLRGFNILWSVALIFVVFAYLLFLGKKIIEAEKELRDAED